MELRILYLVFLSNKYIDQFVLIGDRRMYLSALIVPDFEALQEYADSHKISYSNTEDLSNNELIRNLIENELSYLFNTPGSSNGRTSLSGSEN